MTSKAAIASTVILLLAAMNAVSSTADKASLLPMALASVSPPKRSAKLPNLASVSPPKASSKWSTPASVSDAQPRPSLMASSPPASATCVTSLLDLSPCLSFFKDASATAAPPGCCDGLRTIIGTQALCLCHIVNHSLERAIGVDIPIDRAFHLLGNICSLALPPEVITSCGNKDRVPPLYACPIPSA